MSYELALTDNGGPCPGWSPAAQGECFLHQGRRKEATLALRRALDTRHQSLAALRLGDMALEDGRHQRGVSLVRTSGDRVVRAAGARAAVRAQRRLLTDPPAKASMSLGLLEPFRTEMLLRGARAAAYEGRVREA